MAMQSEHQTHKHSLALQDVPRSWDNVPRIIGLGFIRLYQRTLSRMFPANTCRFYPTCSHYGYEAVYKYGIFRGGWMAFKRILRCQPFHPGGHDPVP